MVVNMDKVIKTEIIEKFMEENKLSEEKFCKTCNISTNTLKKILTNDLNFEIQAIFKISRRMGVKVFEFFN